MAETIECVVVGAGVIGLAVARALALAGREVVVLEAAEAIGTEISSRNSEVIHAGIYYPEGSLKARFCVDGKLALYRYCDSHGIPYRRLGKLIVASDEGELAMLDELKRKGAANGVDDLELLEAAEVCALEPLLACTGALLSPSTGIVDSHALMLALQGDAESRGAMIALLSPLLKGTAAAHDFRLEVGGAGGPTRLGCRLLVNAAGLGAQAVATALDGMPRELVPRRYLAKGSYFSLTGRPPFRHLVYPVPGEASLGLHYSIDLAERPKFGPDVEWVDAIDYHVDGARAERFYEAIRRYYPGLRDGALSPDYAGIRPKLQAPGEAPRDFLVQGPAEHGIAGLVNLFGIESPGLTACLAIADHVVRLLDGSAEHGAA